jgi:hypothetical protein
LILESLRAGIAFLPRAWARPWFVALMAATALIGLAIAVMEPTAAWLRSAAIAVILLYPPLAEGPLYTFVIPEAPAESTLAGGVARYVRLVAVGLLTVVFLAIPGLLLAVIGLGAAYGMAFAYPGFSPTDAHTWTASGPVLVAGGTVLTIGGLGILWLSARVGLGAAATVAQRRILMLSSWPLTRGFGWRLALSRLIVTVGALMAAWAVMWALSAAVSTGWAARAIPVVGALIFIVFRLPLEVGVLGYFHAHRLPLPLKP